MSPQGNNFRSGKRVDFQSENFVDNSLRWDFGDGTVENGPRNRGHVFQNPGNYTVKAFDFGGNSNTAITCQVAVEADNRQLQVSPLSPRAGQEVNFAAGNFPGADLKWNFGDGKIENGGTVMTHAYAKPGNFQVLVWDAGDAPDSAVKTAVMVQPDIRQVVFSGPPDLFQGAEFDVEARNFAGANLKWDFGDGTVESGSGRKSHRYARPGNYVLQVAEADAPGGLPLEKRIQVLADNRDLAVKTGVIFANSEFEITAVNFRGEAVSWDFGDGPVTTGPRLMRHRYNRTGQFRVRAVDFAGRDGKFIEKTFLVEEDSRRLILPAEIIAGEAVDIRLQNAAGGNFVWRFSDGDSRSGPEMKGKAFRVAGPQKITVADPTGKFPPLEKMVQVLPDTRALKSSARFILPGDEVTFTAANFKGPGIRWDFGDGAAKENGMAVERHVYATLGRFLVKAVDFGGRSSKVFSAEIVAADMTPGFEIDTLELVFASGKYYRVIAKGSPGPEYRLRVKARGRGVLNGQFVLDNMPMGLFQLLVNENQVAQLPKNQMAALPAMDPGLHELTVKFSNYEFNKKIPILKYFVSLAGAIQIVAPVMDGSVPLRNEIRLSWAIEHKKPRFEIAVSAIPFQFMDDRQIVWQPVAGGTSFAWLPGASKPGSWVYWQVRLLNENKQVLTTSEIAAFKLSE